MRRARWGQAAFKQRIGGEIVEVSKLGRLTERKTHGSGFRFGGSVRHGIGGGGSSFRYGFGFRLKFDRFSKAEERVSAIVRNFAQARNTSSPLNWPVEAATESEQQSGNLAGDLRNHRTS